VFRGKWCWTLFGVLLVVFLLSGRAGQQGAAEQALKAVERLINQGRTDAAKYVPEQLRTVETALAATKGNLQKGDYGGLFTAAGDLEAKTQVMVSAAAAKKNELMASWKNLKGGVPRMIEALRSRIGILSEHQKLPANVTQAQFDNAKSGLASIQQQWTEASEAYKAGDLTDAVAKAKWSRDKAAEIMSSLGMPVPAAAKL